MHGRVRVRVQRCPARPASAGCVYTKRPRTIFVRPGLRDPRGVLLHELGHVFDLTVMNNRDRGAFRRIMRRRAAKWWRGPEPLAEQFAEAYSWCARYARIVSIARYSSYDYRPTARQHKRICKLVRSAAGDRRAAAQAAGAAGGHAAARRRRRRRRAPRRAPCPATRSATRAPSRPRRRPPRRCPVPIPTPTGTAPPLPTPPPLP